MTTTLPPKVPGEHRWVIIAVFTIASDQVASATTGSAVTLTDDNQVESTLGCVDCMQEWPATPSCPADTSTMARSLTGENT